VNLGSANVRAHTILAGLIAVMFSEEQKRKRSAYDEDGHTTNDTTYDSPDRGFFLAIGRRLALHEIRVVFLSEQLRLGCVEVRIVPSPWIRARPIWDRRP